MNYQRSRIEGEPKAEAVTRRRVARTLTSQRFWSAAVVVLVALLLLVVAVAFATRPLPRENVPSTMAELRDEIGVFHQGDDECVRWPAPKPLGDEEVERFLSELGQGQLAPDLHTILPVLSAVRVRNFDEAQQRHKSPADVEFLSAVEAKLGPMDRVRFSLRDMQTDTVLPIVQGLREESEKRRLDRGRLELFDAYLGDRKPAADALVDRWRTRLASREAQQTLVHTVAERNTRARVDAIQAGLAEYRARFGSYPPDLARLVGHLDMTDQLTPILMRGVERDGAVRDGWLRHFEYYRVGEIGYRLTSEGPSAGTSMDDLIVSELDGVPGIRLPGSRQGE